MKSSWLSKMGSFLSDQIRDIWDEHGGWVVWIVLAVIGMFLVFSGRSTDRSGEDWRSEYQNMRMEEGYNL